MFMVAHTAANGQRRKPAIGRFSSITVEQAHAVSQAAGAGPARRRSQRRTRHPASRADRQGSLRRLALARERLNAGRLSLQGSEARSSDTPEQRHRRPGDECLNEVLFLSLARVRAVLQAWRDDYNHVRPHSGIGGLTPADAARRVVQHRPDGHHTDPGLQL